MSEGGVARAICDAFHICHSCVTVPDCEWHMDPKTSKCQKMKEQKHIQSHMQSALIPINKKVGSSKNVINRESISTRKVNKTTEMKDTRKDNHDIGSNSDPNENKPQPPLVGNSGAEIGGTEVVGGNLPPIYEIETRVESPTGMRSHSDSPCDSACSDRTTCSECLQKSCMWCKNLRMCTDRNAYLASFPYGQCMDWTTIHGSCPILAPKTNGKIH